MKTLGMTSNRPYLLRAMYDWISDNGLTPYILVDAAAPGVDVPQSAVKDGRVVLNVAARAARNWNWAWIACVSWHAFPASAAPSTCRWRQFSRSTRTRTA